MLQDTFFIGIGDIHADLGPLKRIPDVSAANAIIISGDLTNRGSTTEAEAVFSQVRAVNPVVYAQIGNMDTTAVDAVLTQHGINIHGHAIQLTPGLSLIGVGWSTPTPFGTPSEAPEDQIETWLESAYENIDKNDRLLLVSHTPPFGTLVDCIGSGLHVGSSAVRQFIERVSPDVCLTGHIHESANIDTIGSTTIVNPGMATDGGYARINFYNGQLSADLHYVGQS
ncbi:metallophosphoesterase [Desulfovibrio inopinatus]|uniref:metallophosphoesterase n=1 Tax=Desulfovibrio inopinatus TaxID=102109 RepID=UPI00041E825A|nr:metallophosphoesterase [Desulfovibrio inopinatus]